MPTPSAMRALAHPIRVQILATLQNENLTASEIATRAGTSKTNAHYHLNRLVEAGHVVIVERRTLLGGTTNVYASSGELDAVASDPESVSRYISSVAAAVQQRLANRSLRRKATVIDDELWLTEEDWRDYRLKFGELTQELVKRKLAPGTKGATRVSLSVIAFDLKTRKVNE